ncbi:hypothetical protein EBR21_07105 [bacterium]|nr:hypothetical protein [bacterium]
MPRDQKQAQDQTWLSREDLQDIAKIGGDLLKRTVSSGIDVLKDVTDTLPKDAQQIISRREFRVNLPKIWFHLLSTRFSPPSELIGSTFPSGFEKTRTKKRP